MTLHHHYGDVVSIVFSPGDAFFLTRLMCEVLFGLAIGVVLDTIAQIQTA
jgi:flagellar biosynthesis protein FliR